MHEYSIVQSLIQSCEQHAASNNAKSVSKVVIKVGVLSGVEPELLREAFETFKEDTVCHDAFLDMKIQKILIKCNSCLEQIELEKHEFLCPKCNGSNIDVLDGEEMFLMQLEME
ncbi:MAG: hydrogenase/urease nickel incorporation protein HypA [Campylobacterota bacterium]|nr:hydrogenase/urease nickel incorporation protein HypA [Campylobacterota bacterium]